MREIVRDPSHSFPCPRCGRPVTYKGRGRRPIWCSSTCRVEASIERRGNRLVGVEPEVVRLIDLHRQRHHPRQQRPNDVSDASTDSALIDLFRNRPTLLLQVLPEARKSLKNLPQATQEDLASQLDETLAVVRSEGPDDADLRTAPHHAAHHKREAGEWAQLLDELAKVLANGQYYNRDLPAIYEPLKQLVQKFEGRRAEWARF